MITLEPNQYLRFMEELAQCKYTVGSFSYQMTGGRYTRLTVKSGRGKSVDHYVIPAGAFPAYKHWLEDGAFY